MTSVETGLRALLPSGTGVIKCTAPAWCAPCRALRPTFRALEKSCHELKFVELDMDDAEAAASAEPFGVQGLPTVLVAHEGVVVETIVGADHEKLRGAVARLQTLATADGSASSTSNQIALPYAAQASLRKSK